MDRVTVDDDLAAKLADTTRAAEVYDGQGRLIGIFKPQAYWREYEKCLAAFPLTEEELRQRLADGRGGRSLEEIMRDLQKRAS